MPRVERSGPCLMLRGIRFHENRQDTTAVEPTTRAGVTQEGRKEMGGVGTVGGGGKMHR